MNTKNLVLRAAIVATTFFSPLVTAQSLEEQFRQAENAKAAQANAEGEQVLNYVADHMRRYKYVMSARPAIFKIEPVRTVGEHCRTSLDNERIYVIENVAFLRRYAKVKTSGSLRSFQTLGKVEAGKLVFDEKRMEVLSRYNHYEYHGDDVYHRLRDLKCKYELNLASGTGYYAINNSIEKIEISRSSFDEDRSRERDFDEVRADLMRAYPALHDRISQIFDGR